MKSEREDALSTLTGLVLSSLLDELLLDCTLQAHKEVAKSSTVCKVCNTRCRAVHVPSSLSQQSTNIPSRSGTPSSTGELKSHTGTSTPTSAKVEGALLLDCVSCGRQIASNRYAPHLSSCMGLSSSRRGAPRANTKLKPPSDAGRSASPTSEGESDDRPIAKSKALGKGRLEDDEFSLKRKRHPSPQISPSKKSKGKGAGSQISRVKADRDTSGVPGGSHYSPSNKSQSRIPSKLRDSSIAPYNNDDNDDSDSQSSSPGALGTPASSTFTQSPKVAARPANAPKRGRPPGSGTGPPKRPSPPRPVAPAPVIHFAMDDGDETGSSTDSNSD
ncbi:hypothetical protein BKA70DRAFT_1252134 [Coprinopsis sp. MPI-PUGE-AT-0042]|nr:hypothetical protein BKA70DRAFT_1252134 [Coprinopsis sp. MPI-PUGE-AT-0042]